MKCLLILSAILISGCGTAVTQPQVVYQKVEVPGPTIYCKIIPVEKPIDLVMGLKTTDDIHYKVKTLLADRELKEGYITKLETAITSCNQSN